MIRDTTIPVWPEHVELTKDAIQDHVLDIRHEINDVSYEILQEVDGHRSIIEICNRVCKKHNWPPEQVLPDIRELVLQLNERYLINVRQQRSLKIWLQERWITVLVFMRILQGADWQTRHRIDLGADKGIGITAIGRIGMAVLKAHGLLGFFLVAITSFLLFALEVNEWLWQGICVGFFYLLGNILHEWGHHVSYQKSNDGRRPSFLAVKRLVLQIVRRQTTPENEWKITLAGPLLPFAMALIIAVLVWMGYWPGSDLFGWAVVIVLGIHPLSLIPPAEDGKRLMEAIRARKLLVKQEGE